MSSKDAAHYLFHHLFLPPKAPQSHDADPDHEHLLVQLLINSLTRYRADHAQHDHRILDHLIDAFTTMQDVHRSAGFSIDKDKLLNVLTAMASQERSLPLYIQAQNAGVLVVSHGGQLRFEVFELSPRNSAVFANKGRLRRRFPGFAAATHLNGNEATEFYTTVAETLAQMGREVAMGTLPTARKAGRDMAEDRDTAHPGLVSELFASFLGPISQPAEISTITKNTREEVFYKDARLPWRRAPLWLLLRVVMQVTLSRKDVKDPKTTTSYKEFMIYFLANILEQLQHSLPPPALYTMTAKIAQRLVKLKLNSKPSVVEYVRGIVTKSRDIVTEAWSAIQESESWRIDSVSLRNIDLEASSLAKLTELDSFVSSIDHCVSASGNSAYRPKVGGVVFDPGELPQLQEKYNDKYGPQILCAFEEWVSCHLKPWTESHKKSVAACGDVGSLMTGYYSLAMTCYLNDAEAKSRAILTTLELWRASDIIATSMCPLLKQYSPGIPVELLQNLLLATRCQMNRLGSLEVYIGGRTSAPFETALIFETTSQSNSFAARFFDQSAVHQAILQAVESEAHQAKEDKLEELQRVKATYASHYKRSKETSCEYIDVPAGRGRPPRSYHSNECQSCFHADAAAKLTIEVHEWPLPRNPIEAKAVVFELQVPKFIGCWRETTWFLLLNVLKAKTPQSGGPRASYHLSGDRQLKKWWVPFDHTWTQRISLLSETKPHLGTHRDVAAIPRATTENVCLHSGLRYRYFDHSAGSFVHERHWGDEFALSCTHRAYAERAYLAIHLFRPAREPNGPAPNTVLASLSQCPKEIRLEEYREVCSLAYGFRLQWISLLTQLSMPTIDFRQPGNSCVIRQIIYQVGPSGGTSSSERPSHSIVCDDGFALQLLNVIRQELARSSENWDSAELVHTLIVIARRVYSLTYSAGTRSNASDILQEARTIMLHWMSLLNEKARDSNNDAERTEFEARTVEMALICMSTLDVGPYLSAELESVSTTFLLCAITAQQGEHSLDIKTRSRLAPLITQCRQLLQHSCERISRSTFELDDAIKRVWSAYKREGEWELVRGSTNWMHTHSSMSAGTKCSIDFDLLSGELLVDGVPLKRPPAEYLRHPSYLALFGRSLIEVMPGTLPGKRFSSKSVFRGFNIQLSLVPVASDPSISDLLVRATDSCSTLELIPARLLRDHFPSHFVEHFIHWYNLAANTVDFVPVDDPWSVRSPHVWTLRPVSGRGSWLLEKNGEKVLPLSAEAANELAKPLQTLAESRQTHLLWTESSRTLEITIPHLNIGFSMYAGTSRIVSKEFRNLQIDLRQSLGTLVGVQSKLILKHVSTGERLVLIPEGVISHSMEKLHTRVSINPASTVRVHAYQVDDLLGRLVDQGDLQSKFYLAYLHALSSFCVPDALTCKTGVESSLEILDSAAVFSFTDLSESNINVLNQIANLTPTRAFYPANERVMQTIDWSDQLPFLTQTGDFYNRVQCIFNHSERQRRLASSESAQFKLKETSKHLLHRDLVRSSFLKVSGFGAEMATDTYDMEYEPRDRDHRSERSTRSLEAAAMVYRDRPELIRLWAAHSSDYLWKLLSTTATIEGFSNEIDLGTLRYDQTMLHGAMHQLLTQLLPLHRVLGVSERAHLNKFNLMIWLATAAWAENTDTRLLQTIVLFYCMRGQLTARPPMVSYFSPSQGVTISETSVRGVLRRRFIPLEQTPEHNLDQWHLEAWEDFLSRRKLQLDSSREAAVIKAEQLLSSQWPCRKPDTSCLRNSTTSSYLNLEGLDEAIKPCFEPQFDNRGLRDYLNAIERVVCQLHCRLPTREICLLTDSVAPSRTPGFVAIDELFNGRPPPFHFLSEAPPPTLDLGEWHHNISSERFLDELKGRCESSQFQQTYIRALEDSFKSLDNQTMFTVKDNVGGEALQMFQEYSLQCRIRVDQIFGAIVTNLRSIALDDPGHYNAEIASLAYKWPRLSPMFLLKQLNRTQCAKLSADWKRCLLSYGLALTSFQRATRMLKAARIGNTQDLIRELRNSGHQNWQPFAFPESVLLEIESGILIRKEQEDVAKLMRDPPQNVNSVMQLNMGEGKSSVIVPIVAVHLADGSRLVRAVVQKAQSKQMAQMLVSKLGGLLNRRVYFLPFSRSLKVDPEMAASIEDICRECMRQGGVMLVQPEHLLSMRLMIPECLISGKEKVGKALVEIQEFLEGFARDIVDESDDVFSVKYELIYTMGAQSLVEMSPGRWSIIHQVLDLIRSSCKEVVPNMPHHFDMYVGKHGSFPRLRILDQEGAKALLDKVAGIICAKGLDGFPMLKQHDHVKRNVLHYITTPKLTSSEIEVGDENDDRTIWTGDFGKALLLLRGLFAKGVLFHVLSQKRWRVDYGLDPTRSPPKRLAIPFRAKDVPSPRSEFSHTDGVILYTCLSYYYQGLEDEHMEETFRYLLDSDQKEIDYPRWVADAHDLPAAYHSLGGVNLKDQALCRSQIYPSLRHAKSVVDYFLSNIVFPREMKDFPLKLSASGWDIGRTKQKPLAGFSGTSDLKEILPLDVNHVSVAGQEHTNALVINHLLRPDNGVDLVPRTADQSTDAETLLSFIVSLQPAVRVILDVGAQIIELRNVHVAKRWLELQQDEGVKAAIFVNDDDDVCVIDRLGRTELLQVSTYLGRMGECLVFLDEAHTRGIDLKLPQDYRAAVTLGAKLTKDRLAQACMRMRKLGQGQTVVFCVPAEIERKIRGLFNYSNTETVSISMILVWAIKETWDDIEKSVPMWTVQAKRFIKNQAIWASAQDGTDTVMTKDQAKSLQEKEALTIRERYHPHTGNSSAILSALSDSPNPKLQEVWRKYNSFHNLSFESITLLEEQERELSPEIKSEREVERPNPARPAKHELHPDLKLFVTKGSIVEKSSAYLPAFSTLRGTTAATASPKFRTGELARPELLASQDFARTVLEQPSTSPSDAYTRPVRWLLVNIVSGKVDRMIIISPFEAQELYPLIAKSTKAALFAYKPRWSTVYRALDRLDTHMVSACTAPPELPRSLAIQLNLFAGQLYFNTYNDYLLTCKFLGLAPGKPEQDWTVAADMFVIMDASGRAGLASGLTSSPMPLIKALTIRIRRDGERITGSHVGSLLDGNGVHEEDIAEE